VDYWIINWLFDLKIAVLDRRFIWCENPRPEAEGAPEPERASVRRDLAGSVHYDEKYL
jgi:hypothetical protein